MEFDGIAAATPFTYINFPDLLTKPFHSRLDSTGPEAVQQSASTVTPGGQLSHPGNLPLRSAAEAEGPTNQSR